MPSTRPKKASHPVALITGGGSGLGAALALKLSRAGYRLLIHYFQNKKGANALLAQIKKEKGDATLFQADLSLSSSALELCSHLKKHYNRLDLLINNSSLYLAKPLSKTLSQVWEKELASSASAAFFVTQAVLPLLKKKLKHKAPRIINIGDSSCENPTARDLSVGYHVGKTGLLILTRSFASLYAPYGITVNMISPGILENSVNKPNKKTIPANTYGTFEDIGNALQFFLKPESGYVTGSNLIVSGGWNLR